MARPRRKRLTIDRIGEVMENRIYVWGTSANDARAQAVAELRKRGHKPPFPEFDVHHTGLTRAGSYDIDVKAGFGEYTEVVGDTSRRYACDPRV